MYILTVTHLTDAAGSAALLQGYKYRTLHSTCEESEYLLTSNRIQTGKTSAAE